MRPALRYYYYSGSGGVPEYSDVLFHLNGVIEEDSGSYYFSDHSGNNRRFLITNKDFPSDWTIGFPYKSQATISAPADDAVLIAADINNYLYASDGTPNEIPVVSLFQDVDYEHKLFCRHREQVLGADDEEVIAPRVAEIVLYNGARTGTGLTECQSYFSVPVEVTANVKWVSKSGNDTTGTGGKAASWLTISKASYTSGSNGDTIYVKSGDYSEDYANTGASSMGVNKNVTIICIGRVKIVPKGTVSGVVSGGTVSYTLKGAIIDKGSSLSASGVHIFTGASSITIERCFIKGAVNGISAFNQNITSKDNVFVSIVGAVHNTSDATYSTNYTVTGCCSSAAAPYIVSESASSTALRTGIIKYSKFLLGGIKTGNGPIILTANFNEGYRISLTAGGTGVADETSIVRLKYNNLTGAVGTTSGVVTDGNNYNDVEIAYNSITEGSTGAIISTYDNTLTSIHHNKVVALTSEIYGAIAVYGNASNLKEANIYNNYVRSGGGLAVIQIGNETESDGFSTISGSIYNNTCVAYEATPASHGVIVFNNSDLTIKYNYVEGFAFGCLFKVANLDLSAAVMAYNVLVNCGQGVATKGGVDQMIHNNTIVDPVNYGYKDEFYETSGPYTTSGTILKNNIFVDTRGVNASFEMFHLYDDAAVEASDDNVFYSTANTAKFYDGTDTLDLSEWRTGGFDASSIITNPNLDDDYVPAEPILIGENLGSDYDAGLDISTNWGSSSAIPVVVTRDQVAVGDWEVGAYVQR